MARLIYAALLGLALLAGCAGCAGKTQPVAAPTSPAEAAGPEQASDAPEQDASDTAQADDTTPEGTPAGTTMAATADTKTKDDPPGKLACGSLSVAVQAATLMNPGVVDGIVKASVTADAPVADAARRLATAYAAAVKSHGTDGEPDAIAAVSMAGAEMTKICQQSGLNAAG